MTFPFTKPRGELLLALAFTAPAVALAQSGAPSAQALAYFSAQSQRQGLRDGDAVNPSVTSSYFDQSNGLTHTYLRQRVNGLDIYGAVGDVHTNANGKPVLMHQSFVADAAHLAPTPTPTLSPEQAVSAAAAGLKLPRPVGLTKVREARPADGLLFNNGGISEYDIPVRLMYLPIGGKLRLVWNVTIAQLDHQHHWTACVDAQTGQLLDKADYVVSEETSFQQQSQRTIGSKTVLAKATTQATSNRSTANANSVTVWPMPLEAPSFGARVSVPFSSINTTYSPFGWQVNDPRAPAGTFPDSYSRAGSTPAVYLTRGNNVAAYDDSPTIVSGSGNLASDTNSPSGGPTLDFDFPFVSNQATSPQDNAPAAITNLFYWNNILHDVMMSKGFDEASGNFQFLNTSTQGRGNDFVRAEAQDGSGRDNANFSTPPDGINGRMQMYLFGNKGLVTISAPSSLAGNYTVQPASWGRKLTLQPRCGNVVAVNDGVSGNGGLHGCATPYANAADVNGNIALIMRGGCAQLTGTGRTNNSFNAKVRRAQENGAIMAIIIDSAATSTRIMSMGGTDTIGIRIPSVFMSGVDGARLQQALQAGITVTGCAVVGQDIDGALDNGIVAHEFGHGISNRLTGGPNNSNCVTQTYRPTGATTNSASQCMGEGWSDFFALWVTTRPGDVGRTPRGIGTYASAQLPTESGIRLKRYSDDITMNNYTYSIIGTPAYNATHNVGEVWATALWDLNWQFIYRYGYNPDFLAASGGNNQFLKLVLDGCKLQVCNPGFLDGRDAILRADTLLNGAAHSALIWTMFARRGMGYSAAQGTRAVVTGYPNGLPSLNGITEAFDIPPGVRPATILNPAVMPLGTQSANAINSSLVEAYPNPAQNVLTIQSPLTSKSAVTVSLVNLIGQVVSKATAAATELQRGVAMNTSSLAEGLYIVRVKTSEGLFTTKVQVKH
ncbi:M36 family metallopeptidase [Hymenobacter terrenus]|uniref:M36 family metallopeptidase n=1 Tax=Hymenobacter terrenus TaxID=1629124 RepID=UPI0006976ED4|nr:M36 family metallopeptidase [Hymenobacter terrenus]